MLSGAYPGGALGAAASRVTKGAPKIKRKGKEEREKRKREEKKEDKKEGTKRRKDKVGTGGAPPHFFQR